MYGNFIYKKAQIDINFSLRELVQSGPPENRPYLILL